MLSRNTYLEAIPAGSYVDADIPVTGAKISIIDCALGTNPFGTPKGARAAFLAAARGLDITSYPEPWNEKLKRALAAYWTKANIGPTNIILGAGSIGILQRLNTLFLAPGAQLLGVTPQFTDYVRAAQARGANYQAVNLKAPEFKISAAELLEQLNPDIAAVYIDNPHNPTGQVVPLADLEAIAAKALAQNTALIVDEAYGDFMPQDNSAINLVDRYPNTAVARSFSKGWGLAGLRVGYGVINTKLRKLYAKIDMPFSLIDPAAAAATAALAEPDFIIQSREKTARIKRQIRQQLTCLNLAHSYETTPIMTLTAPCPGLNLKQQFLRKGVLVVDGNEFAGLSSASVRLRVPAAEAELLDRLATIEAVIS